MLPALSRATPGLSSHEPHVSHPSPPRSPPGPERHCQNGGALVTRSPSRRHGARPTCPKAPCRQTARSERDRSEGRSRDEEANLGLILVGLGASGSAALRAEVFVEVAGWEDEKQTLSGGRGLTARRTVEQRGAKRPVLVAGRLAPLFPRRRAAGRHRAPGTRRSGPRVETRALGTGRTHEAILSKSVSRGQAGEKVLAPSPGLVL